MLNFIGENVLFILTILGAVISFIATFIGITFKKKPVMIMALLAVIGFAIGMAYQFTSYTDKNEEKSRKIAKEQITAAAQLARDNILDAINSTVKETKITIDTIAEKLLNNDLLDVATELVDVTANGRADFHQTAAFAKGNKETWKVYASWLKSQNGANTAPSLTLTFNSDHQYDSGYLLAYLLTSELTRNRIDNIFRGSRSNIQNFKTEKLYLDAYLSGSGAVEWVLFYIGSTTTPIAYAEAKQFTRELMIYHNLKQHKKVNKLLNPRDDMDIVVLQELFPSVMTSVLDTSQPAELVKHMLEKQLTTSVAVKENRPYIAQLTRLISIAATN